MSVKLRVIHGALKKNDRFQVTVPVTKTPFVFGRSAECDMRCHSTTISRRHCEIRVTGFDITLVDLNSRNGVCVNGRRVEGQQPLKTGDRIAIGKLEFELVVEAPKRRAGLDPLGDSVCELLLEADRREPDTQFTDSRWYKIEQVDPYEGMSEKERLQAKARAKIPEQKRPQKLPKRVAESSDIAVRQTLAKYSQSVKRCYRRPQTPQSSTETAVLSAEDTRY